MAVAFLPVSGAVSLHSTVEKDAAGVAKQIALLDERGMTCGAFSIDGSLLALGRGDANGRGLVKLYSLAGEEPLLVASHSVTELFSKISQVAISPDSKLLALTWAPNSIHGGYLELLSLEHLAERNGRAKVLFRSAGVAEAASLAFAPDGRLFMGGESDNNLLCADFDREELMRAPNLKASADALDWKELFQSTGRISEMQFSRSGELLFIAGEDNYPRILSLKELWSDGNPAVIAYHSMKYLEEQKPNYSRITCSHFSPDGKRVAIGDNSGRVRIIEG
jgi:WD40 repeat protein